MVFRFKLEIDGRDLFLFSIWKLCKEIFFFNLKTVLCYTAILLSQEMFLLHIA